MVVQKMVGIWRGQSVNNLIPRQCSNGGELKNMGGRFCRSFKFHVGFLLVIRHLIVVKMLMMLTNVMKLN
jgi:hypothetical protein